MINNNEDYTKISEDDARPRFSGRARSAWWIYSFYMGRTIVLGPYADESDAERDLLSKLEGRGEVILLNTIDRNKATAILKKRTLDDTSNIAMALRRARHEKGLAQDKKRGF